MAKILAKIGLFLPFSFHCYPSLNPEQNETASAQEFSRTPPPTQKFFCAPPFNLSAILLENLLKKSDRWMILNRYIKK